MSEITSILFINVNNLAVNYKKKMSKGSKTTR